MINRNSIINLNFYLLSHIIKFDPVFTRLTNDRHSILLRVNFFPDWLSCIHINDIPLPDNLQLRSNPDTFFAHIFLDNYVGHLDITDLKWPLVLWHLFFPLLFIFGFFLCSLSFILLSSFHFILSFHSGECFDHDKIVSWILLPFFCPVNIFEILQRLCHLFFQLLIFLLTLFWCLLSQISDFV